MLLLHGRLLFAAPLAWATAEEALKGTAFKILRANGLSILLLMLMLLLRSLLMLR